MIIERTSAELIIKIPTSVNIEGIQDFLNYLRYKELVSKFTATQTDVDDLVKGVKSAWREKREAKKRIF